MTITETLDKIIELTNRNLEILDMINTSFYSKRDHITTVINGTSYTIPSYIALENKVNYLQAGFENLVNLPQTGEAYVNFDGNSRVIQVRDYQTAPAKINIGGEVQKFHVGDSNIFKDMLTPKPYLRFNISGLESDVSSVVVKKIVIYNDDLADAAENLGTITYASLQGVLDSYEEGTDYSEYDTTISTNIRNASKNGEYVVTELLSDAIDSLTLKNTLKLVLGSNLEYYDEQNIAHPFKVGDYLITYNGSAKLKITELVASTNTITVVVENGEFVNIVPDTGSSDIASDYSKLRYYDPVDTDRIIEVPLEEDRHLYICFAPLNSRLRVRADWSDPLYVDTDNLINVDGDGEKFSDYYKENVKNIGDILDEFITVVPNSITKFSSDEYDLLLSSSPVLKGANNEPVHLEVVKINKHLEDTTAIKYIKELYSKKQQYKKDLSEIQKNIAQLTEKLSLVNFDDMTGVRELYTGQISDLKKQQDDCISAINKTIDEISMTISGSDVPLEGAKYRIRGYVDVESMLDTINESVPDLVSLDDVAGIKIRYRYRNPENPQANISTIEDFLFSDWVEQESAPRPRTLRYESGEFIVEYKDVDIDGHIDITANEVKFNQIDVPINQCEIVEIQAAIIWAYGSPFVQIVSSWSDAVSVSFPEEYNQDVTVKSIIEENNSEIETLRFNNILTDKGIIKHVDDDVQDQNKEYFHNAENITSGFYTDERRVIPLSTKLQEMYNDIVKLQDDVMGTYAESLQVSVTVNNVQTVLEPMMPNTINLPAYKSIETSADGFSSLTNAFIKKNADGPVTTIGSISIKNVTKHTLRLFSEFPGTRTTYLNELVSFKSKREDIRDQFYIDGRLLYVTSKNAYYKQGDTVTLTIDGVPLSEWPSVLVVSWVDGEGISYESQAELFVSTYSWTVPDDIKISSVHKKVTFTAEKLSLSTSIIVQPEEYSDPIESDPEPDPETQITYVNIPPSSTVGYTLNGISETEFDEPNFGLQSKTTENNQTISIVESVISGSISGSLIFDRELMSYSGTTAAKDLSYFETTNEHTSILGIQVPEEMNDQSLYSYLISSARKYVSGVTPTALGNIKFNNEVVDNAYYYTVGGKNILLFKVSDNSYWTPISNVEISRSGKSYIASAGNDDCKFKITYTRWMVELEDGHAKNIYPEAGYKEENSFKLSDMKEVTLYSYEEMITGGTLFYVKSNFIWRIRTNSDSETGWYTVKTFVDFTNVAVGQYKDGSPLQQTPTSSPTRALSIRDIETSQTSDISVDIRNLDVVTQLLMSTQAMSIKASNEFMDKFSYQTGNQYITFRIKEPFANTNLNSNTTMANTEYTMAKLLEYNVNNYTPATTPKELICVIPLVSESLNESGSVLDTSSLCIKSDNTQSYISLNPGESLQIPIFVGYIFKEGSALTQEYSIGFDIRNSLYSDPIFYQCTFAARLDESAMDALLAQQQATTNYITYVPNVN